MKTKVLVLLVGIMLLTTFFAVAQPIQKKDTINSPNTIASSMIDVPVWEIGQSWTYKIQDITMDFSNPNQSISMDLSIAELPLIVTEVTDEYYTLTFTTTMNGQGHFYSDFGDGPINVSIALTNAAITGSLRFDKATLGIEDATISFVKQKITFDIIQQPYLPLPDWLHVLSMKVTSDVDILSDSSVTLFKFPLMTGSSWNLSATNLSTTGTIQSLFFNLLNFLNNIAKLFGKEFLPADFAALLPVIDIKDAMTTYRGTNVFQVPVVPYAFLCLNTENISVIAGLFEAFNITLFGGLGQCFFAQDAGNIILLKGNFEQLIPFVKNIDMELTDTTYS